MSVDFKLSGTRKKGEIRKEERFAKIERGTKERGRGQSKIANEWQEMRMGGGRFFDFADFIFA